MKISKQARRDAKSLFRVAQVDGLLDDNRARQVNLELRYGKGLQFSFSQNPALIGGTRVQVGSDVYDGSVRARLNELDESFKAA